MKIQKPGLKLLLCSVFIEARCFQYEPLTGSLTAWSFLIPVPAGSQQSPPLAEPRTRAQTLLVEDNCKLQSLYLHELYIVLQH